MKGHMARSKNMISIQQFDFSLLFFVCLFVLVFVCMCVLLVVCCVYVCVVGGGGGGVPLNALLVLITGKSLLHS